MHLTETEMNVFQQNWKEKMAIKKIAVINCCKPLPFIKIHHIVKSQHTNWTTIFVQTSIVFGKCVSHKSQDIFASIHMTTHTVCNFDA